MRRCNQVFEAQRVELQLQLQARQVGLVTAKADFRKKIEHRKSQIATLNERLVTSENATASAEHQAEVDVAKWSMEHDESASAAHALQIHSNIVAQRLWNI